MSQPDDQPAGSVLPALPAGAVADLQAAQDTGRVHLADTDEAELAAIGAPVLPRGGLAHWSPPGPPGAQEVVDRLVSRGLAQPCAWAGGAVSPAGPLLTYLHLVLHPKARIGLVGMYLNPEPTPSVRPQWRVTGLIDVVRGGLACVERLPVPVPNSSEPLPVTIDVLRLDVLVDEIVAAAFADVGTASPGARVTTVLFADGKGTPTPSRLELDLASGTANLEQPRSAVLGRKVQRSVVDREGFADHLRLRLMAAG